MNRIRKLLLENGFNLQNVTFVDSGQSKITSTNIIATDYTFSCTSLLIWSDNFVYLNHMLPTEATKKEKLKPVLEKLEKVIDQNKEVIDIINVLVCSGVSDDTNCKMKFHDFSNLNHMLNNLDCFCRERDIEFIRYDDVISKYLIYDPNQNKLLVESGLIEIVDNKKINRS